MPDARLTRKIFSQKTKTNRADELAGALHMMMTSRQGDYFGFLVKENRVAGIIKKRGELLSFEILVEAVMSGGQRLVRYITNIFNITRDRCVVLAYRAVIT